MKNNVIYLDKKIDEFNYKIQCYSATQDNLELRRSTWKIQKCQDIYIRLVKFAGGFDVVRPGMRGMAKNIAITSYVKNIEPNFEIFKSEVEIANKRRKKYLRRSR